LQVAGQGFDHAFAPALLLLALGNETAQVPLELDLLLVYVLQGAVLRLADALLHSLQQDHVVRQVRRHGAR